MPQIPLGAQFYESESLPISAQEVVNLYANLPKAKSPYETTLLPTPGIKEVGSGGSDVTRGAHVLKGVPYFVQGKNLYSLTKGTDSSGNVTYSVNDVSSGYTDIEGSDRVIMADNGTSLIIVTPDYEVRENAYIYKPPLPEGSYSVGAGQTGEGLYQISDAHFKGPVSSVTFLDGYYVFTKKDDRTFFISLLRDGNNYISTDFADAEADPDDIIGAYAVSDILYIFGTQTMEPFQNIGGQGFPFQPIQGGTQRKGLASASAIESVNDYMIWLGSGYNETPAIWMSGGERPEKLSTPPIDKEISRYPEHKIERAFSWKYSENGATFIGFTFPGMRCFVYDVTAQRWHTRESGTSDNTFPFRASGMVKAYEDIFVGDLLSGKVGILDVDEHQEFGNEIRRRFVTPHLDNEGESFFINELKLFAESGVGLTSGQGSDPQVSMSFSQDGGRTFGPKIERSVGKIGEYETIATWRQLGRIPFQVCFRFDVSDPVKWAFRKLVADIE